MPGSRKLERRCRVFEVESGWCAAARGAGGICAFVLPVRNAARARRAVLRMLPKARESRRAMCNLVRAVERYFNGWRTEFDEFALDLSGGTEFQQQVWNTARQIGYGQVRTYRWIALEMGRPDAMRAVGTALGANRVPLLVPCHRVIAGDGFLGGFSAEGGEELKAAMLDLERVRMVRQNGRVRVLA